MVLEHIFPEDWLEKKTRYAFLLGVGYSIFGMLIASFLFPRDPALVALAFTGFLILPELYKIFTIEERQEMMEVGVDIKTLFKDDWDIVKIYIFIFMGVFLTYAGATLILDNYDTNPVFKQQLEIRGGPQGGASQTGQAFFTMSRFKGLFSNNLKVMLVCFIIALLTGNGAIFLIIWNASVWGTIFGVTAKCAGKYAALYPGQAIVGLPPPLMFLLILVIVFPHMMIEALAYFCAAISGSIISKDVLLEEFSSDRFKKVLKFNVYLLFIAFGLVVLGAIVETFVLDNVSTYATIIGQSMKGVC
jgi:uncharacterized membrane protein SpoIIM required for sporulation